jgi:hypothetical protein
MFEVDNKVVVSLLRSVLCYYRLQVLLLLFVVAVGRRSMELEDASSFARFARLSPLVSCGQCGGMGERTCVLVQYRKNSDKVNKLSINPVSVFKVSITNRVLIPPRHAVTAGGGQAKKVYDVLFVPEVVERRRHVENPL